MDRLEGGIGNDTYVLQSDDFVYELAGQGVDTVFAHLNYVLGANLENLVLADGVANGTGNELANWIVGNAGNNVLGGQVGNDRLRGLSGNDLLIGGAGNDIIEGGRGADALWGGSGADRFLWRNIDETGVGVAKADVVKDFSFASGDRIHLALIDANAKQAGNQAFTFLGTKGFDSAAQIRYVQASGETRILINTDSDPSAEGTIRLAGKLTPEASWFVL
jgi:Ca2+-binding RTX toxin-like protein